MRIVASISLIIVFLLASGCQRRETGRVEGMVTLDGKPLVAATLITVPERGIGGFAITDEQGKVRIFRRSSGRADASHRP